MSTPRRTFTGPRVVLFTPKPKAAPLPLVAQKAARLFAVAPHAARVIEGITDSLLAEYDPKSRGTGA